MCRLWNDFVFERRKKKKTKPQVGLLMNEGDGVDRNV